jgi:triosephosphate isomerase (TIM)
MTNRKKIVAGNWKMNTSHTEAIELTKHIVNKATNNTITTLFFVPFVFIKSVNDVIANIPNTFVGAQNCSMFEKGAYTGEISANMLSSLNCNYVLVGHSERRHYFNETNEQLIAKM